MAKDLVPVVTPVGELHWVNISGKGKENYNEDGYNYVSTVYLPTETAELLKEKIEDVLGPVPKGKNVKSRGYRQLYRDSEGTYRVPNKDGKIMKGDDDITDQCELAEMWAFTFTTGATFPDGKQKKVGVFNASAGKISLGDRKVGNGSKGAISGKMRRFEKGKDIGVSLFLNAIQLTEFNEYTDDAGFEAQEGDFQGIEDEETGFETQGEETKVAPKDKSKTKPKL